MSGNRFLIDTNIAIYLLAGDLRIAEMLDKTQIYFSFISELELLRRENEGSTNYAD